MMQPNHTRSQTAPNPTHTYTTRIITIRKLSNHRRVSQAITQKEKEKLSALINFNTSKPLNISSDECKELQQPDNSDKKEEPQLHDIDDEKKDAQQSNKSDIQEIEAIDSKDKILPLIVIYHKQECGINKIVHDIIFAPTIFNKNPNVEVYRFRKIEQGFNKSSWSYKIQKCNLKEINKGKKDQQQSNNSSQVPSTKTTLKIILENLGRTVDAQLPDDLDKLLEESVGVLRFRAVKEHNIECKEKQIKWRHKSGGNELQAKPDIFPMWKCDEDGTIGTRNKEALEAVAGQYNMGVDELIGMLKGVGIESMNFLEEFK